MKSLFLATAFIFASFFVGAQDMNKKNIEAHRISGQPNIDGILNETVWEGVPFASDFIQQHPFNGKPATQQNQVKFLYNDNAIFIAGVLYDKYPDSIFTILSSRDDLGVTDFFGVTIDPYNDGLNAYGFYLTAAGVQIDLKVHEEDKDYNWDAVWESAIKINDSAWVVEIKIPYSALRFPTTDVQKWGINIFRNVQRCRERTSWNYIDSKITGENKQAGVLTGISNIKPPLRLSLYPYAAGYVDNNSGDKTNTYSLKGGLDIKYGISESFTLDMMLIPDFGQIQSDDKILNLSPFETYYSEKRSFFNEGTELFEKADIFYSRRIGGTPKDYYNIDLDSNEVISENPFETQLINATKISGKTKSGWSIGSLNAITKPMSAELTDTINNTTRSIDTQPFTNYNITSINKSLPNSSYFSVINSNMSIFDGGRKANVTGTDFKIANKSDKYAVYGRAALSHIQENNEVENGYYYFMELAKIRGNFKFKLNHKLITDNYNPNDLGFLSINNIIKNNLVLNYNIYKPFGRFLEMRHTLTTTYEMIYNPNSFYRSNIEYSMFTTFTNHLSMFVKTGFSPKEMHDYFEPRVDSRVYIHPKQWSGSLYFSSDYRKTFALDLYFGNSQYFDSPYYDYQIRLKPRVRLNDKILLRYTYESNYNHNAGYVSNEGEDVFFGSRFRKTIDNTLNVDYIFTKNSGLSFRLRHYCSTVEYEDFYLLNENGNLNMIDNYSNNEDLNFNAFNIDMAYKWNFLPGSEISIVWKNSIYTSGSFIQNNYFENFEHTLNNPQLNSLSIKILYYLDANYIQNK